jgi:hypothetical protein
MPRVGLDFTGTRSPFAHDERLDFTGIFLDSAGMEPAVRPHNIKGLQDLSTGL